MSVPSFMFNQQDTSQEFLYALLFHLVAPHSSLNKYIVNILKPYKVTIKDENNNAKISTTFSNYIRNAPIDDDEKMVSFDVTSLYTRIPVTDTLNIIKEYINYDDEFTQDKFFDLVNQVLTTTSYTFNVQF